MSARKIQRLGPNRATRLGSVGAKARLGELDRIGRRQPQRVGRDPEQNTALEGSARRRPISTSLRPAVERVVGSGSPSTSATPGAFSNAASTSFTEISRSVSTARNEPSPVNVGTCTTEAATRTWSPMRRRTSRASACSRGVWPSTSSSPTRGRQSKATACGKTLGSGSARWLSSATVSPWSDSMPRSP
jgi:hypothetical protein